MAVAVLALALALALAMGGCSAVRFEPKDAGDRIRPVSRKTLVVVVDHAAEVGGGTLKGRLVLAKHGDDEGKVGAGEAFKERAWRYGCNAVVGVREEALSGGAAWVADCLLSAGFAGPQWYEAFVGKWTQVSPVVAATTAPAPAAQPTTAPPAAAPVAEAAPVAAVRPAWAQPPEPAPAAASPAPVAKPRAAESRAQAQAAEAEARAKAKAAAAAAAQAAAQARAADAEARKLDQQAAAEARKQAAADAAEARAKAKAEAVERKRMEAYARSQAKDEAARRKQQLAIARAGAVAARQEYDVLKQQKARNAAEEAAAAAADAKAAAAAEAARQQQQAEEQAKIDKQRKADEEKARKLAEEEAARKRAEDDVKLAQEEAVLQRKAAAKQAVDDGVTPPQLEFLAKWPDAEEAPAVFAALQRAAVQESPNWLTAADAVVSPTWVERRWPAPPTLQADLAETKATRWRWLAPRDVTASFTVRNPTPYPVVLDLDLPGGRAYRFVGGKASAGSGGSATVATKMTLPCMPDATPKHALEGGLLTYRANCQVTAAPRVIGIRPAQVELAADKRVAEPVVPFDAIVKVWTAVPGSRLAQVFLESVNAELRRRAEDTAAVPGELTVLQPPKPDQPTPVRVKFKNTAAIDLTVLFSAGTGRDERLLLPKGASQEVLLRTLPGLDPELRVLAVLPQLRSLAWLTGNWGLGKARLVVLQTGDGKLHAFALTSDEAGMRRAVPVAAEAVAGVVKLAASVPVAWAESLVGAGLACAGGACDLAMTVRLSLQDQYAVGGARLLVVEAEAGGKKAIAKLESGN